MNNVKPASNTIVITTANTVYSARAVLVSANSADATLTITYANGATKLTFLAPASTSLILEKEMDEMIASSANIKLTKIAFRG